MDLFYLKCLLLLFWCFWFSLACCTNVFDFLTAMHWLPHEWVFRSGNYSLLANTLRIYNVSGLFLNILFIGNVIIQCLSSILFFAAWVSFCRRTQRSFQLINAAFTVSILIWVTFLIMEEIFIAYAYEAVHARLLMFELLTLMTLYLLPDKKINPGR